jgi:hypothetical protein
MVTLDVVIGEPFEARLVQLAPNRVARALVYSWLGLTLALVAIHYVGGTHLTDGVFFPICAAWFPISYAVMRSLEKAPERRKAVVRIDDAGIHVDGKLIVRRRHLRSGGVHAASDGVRVVFRHRHTFPSLIGAAPMVVFLADHIPQAEAILAAAHVDLEQRVFRATFMRPQSAWPLFLAIAVFIGLSAALLLGCRAFFRSNPDLVALALVGAIGAYALTARTVVTVGTDGIEIRRAFRKRFVPLDEIRAAKSETNALCITLTTGRSIIIAPASPCAERVGSFGTSDLGMERALLADRIGDAIRMHKRRSGSVGVASLGRASRSADEWLASLRAIAVGSSDYRTGVVPLEELSRIVTDTTAAADVRVGAAVALRIADPDAAAERIRIAAEATAAPDLRALLTDIAEERDDEKLGRLLRNQ